MRTRTVGAVAGVAAAAVALGVAELAAIAAGSASAPLVAVGGVVVDHAPAPVTEFGITVFGTANKTVLLAGTMVLLAGLAAGIGVAAWRRTWVGVIGLGLLTAVGVAAALTRHGATSTAALPTVAGAVAGGGVFLWLRRRLACPDHTGHTGHTGHAPAAAPAAAVAARPVPVAPDRRKAFQLAGLLLAGAALVGFGSRWLATRREVAAARAAVDLPTPVDTDGPVPADAELRLSGLAGYVTGNDDFYRIDTALAPPVVDPQTWRLVIHGRVRHPYTIDFDDLVARPMVERHITLACVSNQVGGDLVGNARWLGVPVKELIEAAEPLPGADQVVSRSVDGWTCGTPTGVLTDGRDALLAVGMNGQPLPVEHGFPARMVVPGLYGYVSACKWITEIELSSFDDFDAYWVPRGWAALAPIKTQSRIDVPRGRVASGSVTVAGVAWAQHRGIAAVQVRVDGGAWQEATLAGTVSADTWRQWSWQWEATAGEHELAVRATDTTGETQPEQRSQPAPDGATGWHTIRVTVGEA